MSMKLGSLFDGSGTFPLAARMLGIEPVWASEIEPYPMAVTKKNFPDMKHLGSVTGVHGDRVEPVDIITFGSPCQDLSLAGRRAGIVDGERSNLFFEAIRIIKEMRNATAGRSDHNGGFPRFAIWENVPGAFSSNGGADFKAVLDAFVGVVAPNEADVPQPKKWNNDGCIYGDGYSIAWAVLDVSTWVPQRRKRIYLVADFGGESAGEVLFKRKSLSGDFEPCGASWEESAGDPAYCVE